jgi:hypothetical protein
MAIMSAQHIAAASGFYEPQRGNNWCIEIALDDAGDQVVIMQCLDSIAGIRESNEAIEIHYGNEVRYVAGKTRYQPIDLVVKDFVDIGAANALLKWRRQVYNPETGSIGLAREYKKNADLVLVAPNQTISRYYKLIGVYPESYNSGNLSMGSNEQVLVTVTLRIDRMVPGSGLNTALSGLNIGSLTGAL